MPDISTRAPLDGRLQALTLARPIQIWTGDDAVSGRSYTEQGPRPGLPSADRDSHLVVVPSGAVTGTKALEVRGQHGGLPGQVDHGAMVAVRRSDQARYAGWETWQLAGWEAITYETGNTDEEPDCCTLADDSVVVVYRRGTVLRAHVRSASGSITGPFTVYSGDRPVYWPALVAIGDDVYVIAWRRGVQDNGTSSRYYLSVWRSTDGGTTWAEAQDYATTETDVLGPLTPVWGGGGKFLLGRIRAAYRDGEVCVLAHLIRDLDTASLPGEADYVRHWAGPALTTRMDTVETVQGSLGWALPDIVATPSGFLVTAVERVTGVVSVAIGSAWQPLGTAALVTAVTDGTGAGWSEPEPGVFILDGLAGQALSWDPAGVAVIAATRATTGSPPAGTLYAAYSPASGATWRRSHQSLDASLSLAGHIVNPYDYSGGTQGNYPRQYGACWQRGRLVLTHNWVADVATYDDSIALAYFGGWTDLPLPYEDDGALLRDRVGWEVVWLPYELPDNQDYTSTTAGISSAQLSSVLSGCEVLATGDGAVLAGQHHYTWTGTAVVNQTLVAEWEAALSLGGAVGSAQIGVRLRLANVGFGCWIGFYMASTQVNIVDVTSGSALSLVTGLTDGVSYQWRVGMQANTETGAGRSVQVWYRLADQHEDRRWNRVGSWTLADDSGAAGTVPRVEFGHIISGGAGPVNLSYWRQVKFTVPRYAGSFATWHDLDQSGGDNPAKLPGRVLGSAAVYALDGFRLAGRRGPLLIGDSWAIPVSGEYEIERAITLDTPSRRIHHRSVDTSVDVVIPWAEAPTATDAVMEDEDHPPMMALHIDCNWRLAVLQSRTSGGAWATRATIDTRVLQGVTYTRTGRYLRASADGDTTYLHRDEVDPDWTIEFDDGAGTTTYQRPAGNSPGRWRSTITEPRARLELESAAPSLPTAGGVLSLWSPSVTVLVEGVTASAWRLVIDSAHGTVAGDYRTHIAWGEAHILAQPPSWGRGFTAIAGHDRAELEGGLGVRVERAPAARELRIAYDDSVDESEIGTSAEVRYVTAFSGGLAEPSSSVGEIPRSLVRALERQAGRPVGWVVWDRGGGSAAVLRRRHEQLWGTVESAPDLEVAVGDEGTTEVVRIGTITLREER